MVEEISPLAAWEMVQSDNNAVLLDVRSRMEFDYVGHPVSAINIPWQEAPDWQIDLEFVAKVRNALQKLSGKTNQPEDLLILALCRSGSRSRAAAETLLAAGFKQVFNIIEGFEGSLDRDKKRNTVNGWRFHKLPWIQT